MKTLLMICAFAISAVSAQAATAITECDVTKENQAKSITIKKRDTLLVVASGNPTTGYQWYSKENFPSIFKADNSDMIGSGGTYQFPIKAILIQDGETLTFTYKRIWERKKPLSTCKIKVNIR